MRFDADEHVVHFSVRNVGEQAMTSWGITIVAVVEGGKQWEQGFSIDSTGGAEDSRTVPPGPNGTVVGPLEPGEKSVFERPLGTYQGGRHAAVVEVVVTPTYAIFPDLTFVGDRASVKDRFVSRSAKLQAFEHYCRLLEQAVNEPLPALWVQTELEKLLPAIDSSPDDLGFWAEQRLLKEEAMYQTFIVEMKLLPQTPLEDVSQASELERLVTIRDHCRKREQQLRSAVPTHLGRDLGEL